MDYLKEQEVTRKEATSSPTKNTSKVTPANTAILDWGDLLEEDSDNEESYTNVDQRAKELMNTELHGYLEGYNKSRPPFQDKR